MVDRRGGVIPLPVEGGLVSAQLAQILGVEAGGTIRLKVLEGSGDLSPCGSPGW